MGEAYRMGEAEDIAIGIAVFLASPLLASPLRCAGVMFQVFFPSARVVFDVVPDVCEFVFVANDVFVIVSQPDWCAGCMT